MIPAAYFRARSFQREVAMAPQKKRAATSPGKTRMFKLRLPEDIALRIEQKAKAEGRPLARTVINELARFPALDQVDKYADRLSDMTQTLTLYSTRIKWLEASENLVAAVDSVLKAEGAAIAPAIDKLRAARNDMLVREREAAKRKSAE